MIRTQANRVSMVFIESEYRFGLASGDWYHAGEHGGEHGEAVEGANLLYGMGAGRHKLIWLWYSHGMMVPEIELATRFRSIPFELPD